MAEIPRTSLYMVSPCKHPLLFSHYLHIPPKIHKKYHSSIVPQHGCLLDSLGIWLVYGFVYLPLAVSSLSGGVARRPGGDQLGVRPSVLGPSMAVMGISRDFWDSSLGFLGDFNEIVGFMVIPANLSDGRKFPGKMNGTYNGIYNGIEWNVLFCTLIFAFFIFVATYTQKEIHFSFLGDPFQQIYFCMRFSRI